MRPAGLQRPKRHCDYSLQKTRSKPKDSRGNSMPKIAIVRKWKNELSSRRSNSLPKTAIWRVMLPLCLEPKTGTPEWSGSWHHGFQKSTTGRRLSLASTIKVLGKEVGAVLRVSRLSRRQTNVH